MSRRQNQGSAIILALGIILLLVSLGTAGLIFARHERIKASDFLSTNTITHLINAGTEEGISLAHLYANPKRSLCLINEDDPNDPHCNATSHHSTEIGGATFNYELDFTNYEYPDNATFTVRAPHPDFKNETTITLDSHLNVKESTTTIH